jgi:hypothetical protein
MNDSKTDEFAHREHIHHILSALEYGDLTGKVEVLTQLVLALLMEVEALRQVELEKSNTGQTVPKESIYAKAYYETALLTHNGCGPTSGIHKLLALWMVKRATPNGTPLREALMFERLGFSPEEMSNYSDEAERHEMFT